jgi:hypothetical protein
MYEGLQSMPLGPLAAVVESRKERKSGLEEQQTYDTQSHEYFINHFSISALGDFGVALRLLVLRSYPVR